MSLTAACGLSPHQLSPADPPEVHLIHGRYEGAIRAAHRSPSHEWRNGWLGNMLVMLDRDDSRGLCYHWQEYVSLQLRTDIRETGWELLHLGVREGTMYEHHAVVIFDPSVVGRRDLLAWGGRPAAYVLDPWPSGSAAVYLLPDWLAKFDEAPDPTATLRTPERDTFPD